MEKVTFQIYKKNKSSALTTNEKVYPLLLLCLLAFGVGKEFEIKIMETIGFSGFIVLGLLMFYLAFSQLSKAAPLNGRLHGLLQFNEDCVTIDDVRYARNEITKMDFLVGDYEGRYIYSFSGDLNPKRSRGVDNQCIITLESGTKATVNFQLLSDRQFLQMKELLIFYYLKNKISFLSLINYLNIDDYDEIQAFKKNLPKSLE